MRCNLKSLAIIFVVAFAIISCKKLDHSKKGADIDSSKNETSTTNSLGRRYVEEPVSNETMVKWVLFGRGGVVCKTEDGDVEFPVYTPPILENGMLSFASLEDLENYEDALDILLTHWHYSDQDFEETPEEINHLGDEPLNAVDSALGFLSLRSQYELNDFTLNEGWENEDQLYVDDDDYQNVLNRMHEIKIGDNYIKHIGNDMYARIERNDYSKLNQVRNIGYSSILLSGVKIFNEISGSEVPPPIVNSTNGDCPYVAHWITINPVTPVPNAANNSWEVELIFTPVFNCSTVFCGASSLTGSFTVDWLDGTPVQIFSSYNFSSPFKTKHVYNRNFPPSVDVPINVRINFTITQAPQNQLNSCPTLVGQSYEMLGSGTLRNRFDCFDQSVKRLIYSTETQLDGQYYRMKMKLKQRVQGSFLSGKSKFESILVLQRKKANNSWKKIKPPYSMGLYLKGDVYSLLLQPACSSLVKSLNEREIRTSGKKIKIKYKPNSNTYGLCTTPRANPIYLNSDYFFTNGSGQFVSNLNKNLF